ncbi:MarR family transcriptional regulator [Streptomyces sp. R302]|uniref:MarR family transcriptional regulator n=1 Tax=unclassified Streptomyces TaxID=2593676 RepID=UPI00145DF04D|nr:MULTISPECIES: MarR family transcriptional regulator [unclassified Streptomyces]NML53516.1 MarR family transcriptional regulator [Streptomyces sp. R301]NML81877.1 MarR family transcriptional regulator [Streptomyces sp. R302]
MTATAPAADSRVLGLAHYAARGVLEHVLARHGLTFTRQIALRTAVTADTPRTPDELAAAVVAALKTGPAEARAAFDDLRAEGLLVADGPHLVPTDAGRTLLAAVAAEVAPVTARVWAGIPAEDLAATGRVLARVTENADRELAALRG